MMHVNLSKQHPTAYKSVVALNKEVDQALTQAGLEPKLIELVKVRVSQLNGCAFCLRMHTRDALDKGETTDRLALVAGRPRVLSLRRSLNCRFPSVVNGTTPH